MMEIVHIKIVIFITTLIACLWEQTWERPYNKTEETGNFLHPTSYPMGAGGSFLRVKRPGLEADQSPPASGKVKKICIYTR
jgi:hypothetical protein